ncbi:hypothetical protein KC669_04495 [Candidatus Dojkabacteria bacterium]|uniref:Uncharacterized protein n=1 Tax=Candidatus Dojkabacteria bacterium TaxID=2099670 RepID=A0A955RM03_9BACT|nr:hypothetical protein [Candidatus Dojkabacteria bacterium]
MDRFPELNTTNPNELLLDLDNLEINLERLATILLNENKGLDFAVQEFSKDTSLPNLKLLCEMMVLSIPMINTSGQLHPLMSTQEQIQKFLDGQRDGIGDCKLLTILTTYFISHIFEMPTVVSIRSYSGHPILFTNMKSQNYQISFLHKEPAVKHNVQSDPFSVISADHMSDYFDDPDFPNTKSLLYWRVRNATFVLDGMNILRRCVVNYAFKPNFYTEIFKQTSMLMYEAELFADPIIFYWETELDRIKEMYQRRILIQGDRFNAHFFKNDVVNSLRFI